MNTTEPSPPSSHYVIRIMSVGILIALATVLITRGTSALPTWIRAIGLGAENGDILATKLTIAILLFLIGSIAVLGRRGATVSVISATLLAFSGVAEFTATLSANGAPDVMSTAIQLLAASAIFIIRILQPKSSAAKTPISSSSILAVLGCLILSSVVSANLSPLNTATKLTKSIPGTISVHTFEPDDWPQQTLLETGLLEHVPALGTLARIGGPTIVVFYRQNCGMCHDVFKEDIPQDTEANIIAIEVPPGKNVELVETSLPEDIDCLNCTRLALPEGPLWLIETPLVVSIANDTVQCIANPRDEDLRRSCIADTVVLATDQANSVPLPSEDQQLPSR